jgi:UDP-N-acetylmuramoyl-L-alanyl-D-glutamate--2,6-diaminopimelate ligase
VRGRGERLRISELLATVAHCRLGAGDPEILGITHDSRRVRPGWIFAAFRGLKADGATFIPEAVSAGAVAILAEGEPPAGLAIPFVSVENARRTAGILAARLAGDPAERLVLAGVTGTSGKTTTALLIDRMLRESRGETGIFGTIAYRSAGTASTAATHTTPEATDLQPMLGALVRAGGVAAVMECSSHAIHFERLAGCRFDVAIFTNLSRDHLDFHKDLDEYFEAKSRLFGLLKPGGIAVVNADDSWGIRLLAQLPAARTLGFSLRGSPRARIRGDAAIGCERTILRVTAPETLAFESPLLGEPNAENLLAAVAAGFALGVPAAKIAASLAEVHCIPGRMERIENALGITTLVDYAHKPGALEGALQTCRGLTRPGGRIIVVFGCGGERDRGKRPQMGRVAALMADVVMLTSDNPRSEDPEAILAEIEAGVRESGRRAFVIGDRRRAITEAVRSASRGDVVLIAGKGHETYQEIAGRKEPFDDRVVAREILAARESAEDAETR